MTIVCHIIVGLALDVVLCAALLAIVRRDTLPASWRGLAAGGFVAALMAAALLDALLYRGDIFGRAQVLAWTIFLHLPLFLLASAIGLWRRWRSGAWATAGTAALLGLIALDAFLIEPRWLQVSAVTLRSPRLTEPLRVVVLADIQTDAPGAYEARVLARAMAAEPDLLLFAGDYIHLGRRSRGYETELAALRDLMREAGVAAPLGAYAIAGNVDRPGVWTQAFEGLPVATIEATSRYDLGPVVLTGLGMWDAFSVDVALEPEDKFHIVLGHSPNFSLAPIDADLLIAGHTHGGQVQLPLLGPLITLTVAPRSWASGVTEIGPEKTLVVSRGIGMERANAPRLRFLCRPELVVIDLLPE